MRARSVALLLLALGCGLVASIGITQVIGNRNSEPANPAQTDAIFVALEDIAFGEPLTPQVLRLENWPKDKVPVGALASIEDVEGRRTRTKLYAGEPILENKLFPEGASEQGYSTVIPKGSRVVSVKVDKVSGSGLILPGDRVDVLVHVIRNPSRGILKTSTRTILQDVKVFAVNDIVSTENQDEKTILAQTISLLVSPDHAQMIMLAEELGKIRLIMRSPEDDEIAAVPDMTPGILLDAAESEDRQPEDTMASGGPTATPADQAGFLSFLEQLRAKKAVGNDGPGPSADPAPDHRHRMRIVSGPEVRDVVLEMAGNHSDPDHQIWTFSDWQPPVVADRTAAVVPSIDPLPAPALGPAEQEPEQKHEQPPLQQSD